MHVRSSICSWDSSVALVAEALAHLHEEPAPVDELYLPLPLRLLAVREHPDIGGDAGVVEKLIGQRHDRFQPVALDDPAADVALAAAGVAREQRRAVEDDGDAAATFPGELHLRQHVLQEQQRAVVDPRQACAEAPLVAQRVALSLDGVLLLLPLHAKGRIGQHVVERVLATVGAACVAVRCERVAQNDALGVLALDQHVGLADRPGLVVQVLPVKDRVRRAVVLA